MSLAALLHMEIQASDATLQLPTYMSAAALRRIHLIDSAEKNLQRLENCFLWSRRAVRQHADFCRTGCRPRGMAMIQSQCMPKIKQQVSLKASALSDLSTATL